MRRKRQRAKGLRWVGREWNGGEGREEKNKGINKMGRIKSAEGRRGKRRGRGGGVGEGEEARAEKEEKSKKSGEKGRGKKTREKIRMREQRDFTLKACHLPVHCNVLIS